MRSTYQLLMDTLSKEGLEPVAALGERFDPELHEAVQAPDNPDGGDLLVTQELRRGYLLGGRILRPALVAVDHA
jgi:molecular chaperone GrpE